MALVNCRDSLVSLLGSLRVAQTLHHAALVMDEVVSFGPLGGRDIVSSLIALDAELSRQHLV